MQRQGLVPILAVALVAVVTGCKSTTSPAPAPIEVRPAAALATPPAAGPDATRPVIVCFGDSLTAGYGADPGQSYPDYLQKLLDAAGYSYRVVNEGISGNTTKDGVTRLPRVLALHPQIVVLEFGGNDGLRGLPVEAAQRNLAQMIEGLRKSGAQIALAGITLPPQYGPDYIAKFNAMYPALATRYHLRMIPFLLDKVYGTSGDMQDDGVHATGQGNQQVAANVEKLIEPMLKK